MLNAVIDIEWTFKCKWPKEMRELKLNKTSLDCSMDLFGESSVFFRDHTQANWSGFMTQYSAGNYPGKCGFSNYHWPKSEWSLMHFHHTRIRHGSSKVCQCWNTSDNLWPTTMDSSYRNRTETCVYSRYPWRFSFYDELHGKCRNLDERVWFGRGTGGLLWIKYCWAYDHRQTCVKSLTRTLINMTLFPNQVFQLFFPGIHNHVDNAEVGDVDLDLEEE